MDPEGGFGGYKQQQVFWTRPHRTEGGGQPSDQIGSAADFMRSMLKRLLTLRSGTAAIRRR